MFENQPDDIHNKAREQTEEQKRNRRKWTEEQKRNMVAECHEPGMSVWAVGQKYNIPPNQLFKWRKKFEIDRPEKNDDTNAQGIDLHDMLHRIKRLARLESIIMEKLADDIRRKQITCYNASIALSNLVTGLTKIAALTFEVMEKVAVQSPEEQKPENTNVTHEEEREAERMVLELVRQRLKERQARKHDVTD